MASHIEDQDLDDPERGVIEGGCQDASVKGEKEKGKLNFFYK